MSRPPLNTRIDRDTYIPLYIQVMDSLLEYIESGGGKPGEQLPSEPDLCRMFDISRTVIRQALKELEIKGLIYRSKGRGTFIAEPKIRESLFQELTGFYQDMVTKGLRPITKVLKQEVIQPASKIALLLNISDDAQVIEIERLRFVQGEPIVLVTSYLPYALVPGLENVDLRDRSLYAYLEEAFGLSIARGRRTLEAVPANTMEADLLQVKKGAPLLLLNSVGFLADGTPLEYYHALHRSDRSRFEVELTRTRHSGKRIEKLLHKDAQSQT
jgi:GntR family transcriptional regulator